MTDIVLDLSDYLNQNWLRIARWTMPPFGTPKFKKEMPDSDLDAFKKTKMFRSAVNILHQVVDKEGVLVWDYEWPKWLLTTHYPQLTLDRYRTAYEDVLKDYAPGTESYYTFFDDRPPQVAPPEFIGDFGRRDNRERGDRLTEKIDSFPPEVVDKLKYYVYRLIDPRDGETFYVGKGTGNRVFAHIHAEGKLEGDPITNKLKRIREILLSGLEVVHVIHRHGMDEKTAFEVESALIDAYPGLTNIDEGLRANVYGPMHVKQIIALYCAEPAVFQHKAILININRTAVETSLYHATHFAWKINKSRANQAEVILATRQEMIVGAFIAKEWLEATSKNFPEHMDATDHSDRIGFIGEEAQEEIKKLYIGKRVPDEYRKHGAVNPIKYTW